MIQFALLGIFIAFIVLVSFVCLIAATPLETIRDNFTNFIPLPEPLGSYRYVDKQLNHLKQNFDIGKPPGILRVAPNLRCPNTKSILIQRNVAFQPSRHGDGCTFVEPRYP